MRINCCSTLPFAYRPDTVPLAGDTPVEEIAHLLLDVATLACSPEQTTVSTTLSRARETRR